MEEAVDLDMNTLLKLLIRPHISNSAGVVHKVPLVVLFKY